MRVEIKNKHCFKISILVLLDILLLRQGISVAEAFNLTDFNPCFIGYFIVTTGILEKQYEIGAFQSLFYWIFYCYHIVNLQGNEPYYADFNPCFIGYFIVTRTRHRIQRKAIQISILVLLDILLLPLIF